MIFLFLIFCFFYCIMDALRDVQFRVTGKTNHTINAINYGLITSIISLLSLYNIKLDGWYEVFEIAFVMLTIRWILFDGFYNLFYKNSWIYQGDTALTDKWFKGWIKMALKCLMGFFSFLFVLQWIMR